MSTNITAKDADISERIVAFMKEERYTQVVFAKQCGLQYQNFNKYINGKMPWSDRAIRLIADAFDLSQKWIRDGIGDKFIDIYHKDKAEGRAQLMAMSDTVKDVDDYTHVVNTINGNNNSGTQTIQAGHGEVEELRQRIAALEAALAEKDKTIELLRDLVKK